ncbi:MAG: hypothetical protein LBG89_01360 [Rickettsiales bacterium]|jgi:hypothetical protein|nr:hypothetical protein [Rickettsiales bacterium]
MRAVEPYFDFIERRKKPWILVVSARAGGELMPRLSAPGGRRGVLFRRPTEEVALTEITYSVQRHLKTAKNILVAEVDKSGEAVRIYQCPVENF